MEIFTDIRVFITELTKFFISLFKVQFFRFEDKKGVFVNHLYKKRGKMARRLTHSGMATLAALSIIISPSIASEFPGRSVNPWTISSESSGSVLAASTDSLDTTTVLTDQRDKIIEYKVLEGDTVSSIAQKFGISSDTIRWQNDLDSPDDIKVNETLEILPITGISYKVQKGDTVSSISKKYNASAQAIVDYPFNTFVNDETFELAIGQTVIVPDGVKPDEQLWSPNTYRRQVTPDAGSVTATGRFVWPTQGVITQNFAWYHPGVDIANAAAPNVLSADAGRVIAAGWDSTGYGNKVMIDHGNGYVTLYGHLQKIYVNIGQTVGAGGAIGQMGSTGRSTGTHLHFEVHYNGVRVNPLSVLR